MKAVISKCARSIAVWTIMIVIILAPLGSFLSVWFSDSMGNFGKIMRLNDLAVFAIAPLITIIVGQHGMATIIRKNKLAFILFLSYIMVSIAISLLAITQSKLTINALAHGLILNFGFIVLFLSAFSLSQHVDKNTFLRLKPTLAVVTAIIATFALLQMFVLPNNFLENFGYSANTIPALQTVDNNPDHPRIQSTFSGPNVFGAFLIITASASVIIFFSTKRPVIGLISLLITLLLLYGTSSRSAILGTFLVLGILTIAYRRKWAKYLALGVASLAIATIALIPLSPYLQRSLLHTASDSNSPVSSDQQHYSALFNAAQDVATHPIGGGVGSAGPISGRNNGNVKFAENYYLQIAQEAGVLGLLIFISINMLVFLSLFKIKQRNVRWFLIASMVGISLVNLFGHMWAEDAVSFLWWGLAGLALGTNIKDSTGTLDTTSNTQAAA